MNDILKKVLAFLNLGDRQGNLSVTNLAVYTLLAKIAMSPTLDWPTASGLLIALLNYSHKRQVNVQSAEAAK